MCMWFGVDPGTSRPLFGFVNTVGQQPPVKPLSDSPTRLRPYFVVHVTTYFRCSVEVSALFRVHGIYVFALSTPYLSNLYLVLSPTPWLLCL